MTKHFLRPPWRVKLSAAEEQSPAKQDCIKILSDPDATEDEWLAACQALEQFAPEIETSAARRNKRRQLTLGISSLVLLGITVGGASYFFIGSFASTPPAHPLVASVPPTLAQQDIDFGPYMANLQRQIKRHWYPPRGTANERIKVCFKVAKNGEISNLSLLNASGRADANEAALKAVTDTMPEARPLPPGAPASEDIEFTFDYNVYAR